MDGFINLLKPAGMTSHDVVSVVRRVLCTKRVGHAGTLDPMAAGVLVVCVGTATRAAEYIEHDEKSYRCEMKLGVVTDTGDIWGCVSPEEAGGARVSAADITAEQVIEALLSMKGVQDQYPPAYSAIRKNGRHLYEYARNGETVDVEPRSITIYDITPVAVFERPGRVLFDVRCSKGTYVRSICTDIGEKLGCGAAMSFLVRTASGSFSIDDAVTLDEMTDYAARCEGVTPDEILQIKRDAPPEGMERFLEPADRHMERFGSIRLSAVESAKYVNGGKLSDANVDIIRQNSLLPPEKYSDIFCVYGQDGNFLGTAVYDGRRKIFKASKVFFRW